MEACLLGLALPLKCNTYRIMIAKAKTPFTAQLIDFILNYSLFDCR
jgi:hypothetical protein